MASSDESEGEDVLQADDYFFCQPCQCLVNSKESCLDHIGSDNHKKTTVRWRQCLDLLDEELQDDADLTEMLINKAGTTLRGLNHIVAICNPDSGQVHDWICTLCSNVFTTEETLISHLTNFGHIDRVAEKIFPRVHMSRVWRTNGDDVEKNQASKIKYITKQLNNPEKDSIGCVRTYKQAWLQVWKDDPCRENEEEMCGEHIIESFTTEPSADKMTFITLPPSTSLLKKEFLDRKPNEKSSYIGLQHMLEIWLPCKRIDPLFYCRQCKDLFTDWKKHTSSSEHALLYIKEHYLSIHEQLSECDMLDLTVNVQKEVILKNEQYKSSICGVIQMEMAPHECFLLVNLEILSLMIEKIEKCLGVSPPDAKSFNFEKLKSADQEEKSKSNSVVPKTTINCSFGSLNPSTRNTAAQFSFGKSSKQEEPVIDSTPSFQEFGTLGSSQHKAASILSFNTISKPTFGGFSKKLSLTETPCFGSCSARNSASSETDEQEPTGSRISKPRGSFGNLWGTSAESGFASGKPHSFTVNDSNQDSSQHSGFGALPKSAGPCSYHSTFAFKPTTSVFGATSGSVIQSKTFSKEESGSSEPMDASTIGKNAVPYEENEVNKAGSTSPVKRSNSHEPSERAPSPIFSFKKPQNFETNTKAADSNAEPADIPFRMKIDESLKPLRAQIVLKMKSISNQQIHHNEAFKAFHEFLAEWRDSTCPKTVDQWDKAGRRFYEAFKQDCMITYANTSFRNALYQSLARFLFGLQYVEYVDKNAPINRILARNDHVTGEAFDTYQKFIRIWLESDRAKSAYQYEKLAIDFCTIQIQEWRYNRHETEWTDLSDILGLFALKMKFLGGKLASFFERKEQILETSQVQNDVFESFQRFLSDHWFNNHTGDEKFGSYFYWTAKGQQFYNTCHQKWTSEFNKDDCFARSSLLAKFLFGMTMAELSDKNSKGNKLLGLLTEEQLKTLFEDYQNFIFSWHKNDDDEKSLKNWTKMSQSFYAKCSSEWGLTFQSKAASLMSVILARFLFGSSWKDCQNIKKRPLEDQNSDSNTETTPKKFCVDSNTTKTTEKSVKNSIEELETNIFDLLNAFTKFKNDAEAPKNENLYQNSQPGPSNSNQNEEDSSESDFEFTVVDETFEDDSDIEREEDCKQVINSLIEKLIIAEESLLNK